MHFLFLHGAGHGAWCWYKIRTIMEASDHKVTCLDLKSAGIDPADANFVASFDEYNQPLADFLSNLPDNEKVSLVAHSASGANITDAIYRFPEKIHVAIYVAANMWKNGAPSVDIKIQGQSFDDRYDFEYALGPDQPPTSIKVKESLRRKLLYTISPEEDCILASMLLKPTPARARKQLEGPDDVAVPRVFIKTLRDQMAIPGSQDAMIENWPPFKVFEVDSDHSPFFSTPFELFSILVKAANSV